MKTMDVVGCFHVYDMIAMINGCTIRMYDTNDDVEGATKKKNLTSFLVFQLRDNFRINDSLHYYIVNESELA